MHTLNKTLVYLLIFTMISSALAYYIVVRAYEGVFEAAYEGN
jgi:hypothetical protein